MKKIFRLIQLIIITGVLVNCNISKTKKTVEDLKSAFNEESIAAEKYRKFAQEADKEGFDTLSKLFNAVSKSESIHAFNHGKVLEKYGKGVANAEIGSYEVKTTIENLQAALKSESYEMQTMYPGFIRTAEIEKAPEAGKSFTWAWDTEKKHLNYYRQAAAIIAKGNETGLSVIWFVCPTCGNIYKPSDLKAYCDLCLTKKENFIGYAENQEGEK
jgi:rubrerythrin